ncbi:hypothetical protein C1752_17776 [Acaryochloris thomasi RCC1774]|uniref:Uncharacterized protein n=1 Tax=Acaryochloris thomasi RCC1774 TaxID=1764569 RepID=A0A2W1J642_9CYAN|nr:hypothetical protein [Acaryochloris thomasi]PZD70143.1 hypothetical protein C1752_17776 [Acaryochloris thomasi RCC1774]
MVDPQTSSLRQSPRYTNEELIQHFVKGFTQGNPPSLSNSTLQTKALQQGVQLLAGHDAILTAYWQDPPLRAVVKHTTPYGELIKQALLAESFYPLSQTEQSQQYIYQYCNPPHGYYLNCTTAKELWRLSWGRGAGLRSGISLDLLVWGGRASRSHENWRSLQRIDCEQGNLKIKLLGGTFSVESSELVVWAKKQPLHSKTNEQRTRTRLRGYYRLQN